MAARKVVVEITGDSHGYSKATDQAIKNTEGFADRMKKIGLDVRKGFVEGVGIGGGISVFDTVAKVVSGVVDRVGQSVELASNKAEAASKANVLFGQSYGIVEKGLELRGVVRRHVQRQVPRGGRRRRQPGPGHGGRRR